MDTLQIVFIALIVASSITLIVSVLMQDSHRGGASSTITGTAQSIFGKKKAHGMQGLLERITVISAVVFMVGVFIFGFLD